MNVYGVVIGRYDSARVTAIYESKQEAQSVVDVHNTQGEVGIRAGRGYEMAEVQEFAWHPRPVGERSPSDDMALLVAVTQTMGPEPPVMHACVLLGDYEAMKRERDEAERKVEEVQLQLDRVRLRPWSRGADQDAEADAQDAQPSVQEQLTYLDTTLDRVSQRVDALEDRQAPTETGDKGP